MSDYYFVIRYRYPGTVNGRPVGYVYALNCSYLSPGVWSYAKDPEDASMWHTREEAEAELAGHRWWPEAAVVEVKAR